MKGKGHWDFLSKKRPQNRIFGTLLGRYRRSLEWLIFNSLFDLSHQVTSCTTWRDKLFLYFQKKSTVRIRRWKTFRTPDCPSENGPAVTANSDGRPVTGKWIDDGIFRRLEKVSGICLKIFDFFIFEPRSSIVVGEVSTGNQWTKNNFIPNWLNSKLI